MKFKAKSALGIDISDNRISLALLKRNANGVELIKTAGCPIPGGAIKDGNIEDPIALAKAIRELKNRKKIRASHAAISLLARPVLVQILDMPKRVPMNIGQFVQNEVKHYVVLPGRKIALDYCGIGKDAQADSRRVFVVATDSQNVTEIAKACNRAGLDIDAIEPPLLAYARAIYAKKIAGKLDCNVLTAILHSGVLTLCVFRNEMVDFVRAKSIDINQEKKEPDNLCQWLVEQINTVIQFYDVEVADSSQRWEVTVVTDCAQLSEDTEESLKAKIACANLHVRTGENAYQDTPVDKSHHTGTDKPSAVAIGLAMKLLGTNGINLRINLLPAEVAEVKTVKKDVLIIANIAATALFLMILTVGGLSLITGKVAKNVIHKKQTEPSQDMLTLLKEQQFLDGQINSLSERLRRVDGVLSSRSVFQWPRLLNDIRRKTPKTVRITNLSSEDHSRIYLEGLALSYEAVYLFVDMLNKAEQIESASLIETKKDNDGDGFISYAINCSLGGTGFQPVNSRPRWPCHTRSGPDGRKVADVTQ